jgi:hypothetical protein
MPNVEIPLLAWKYVNESVSSELSHTSHHCHHYKSTSVTPTESPISLTHSESANSISKWDEHLPLPIHDWEIPYSFIPLIPRETNPTSQTSNGRHLPPVGRHLSPVGRHLPPMPYKLGGTSHQSPINWEAPLTSWEAPLTN